MSKKIEKGLATRQEIVEAASRLFAGLGYEGTSIEAVLRECNVSRGALYHHFSSKEALFEAAFEALEVEVARRVRAGSAEARDAIGALRAGCDTFLELARDGAVRQIILIDAPSVLGWEKWRAIDARHGFGLLKSALSVASATGALPEVLVETYAHMLLAALIEVAMMIARAQAPDTAVRLGKIAVQDLLTRMLLRDRPAS